MSFSLGNMLSTAWDIGKDFLFGSPGQPTGSGPPIGPGLGQPTSGLLGSGGVMSGFIKKGAGAFLKSQGIGPGQKNEGQYFQPTEFRKNRSVQELTRGQATGRVELSPIQRQLYSNPAVRQAAQRLIQSNNNHMANLRAATGNVAPTLKAGRRTIVTETPELTEIQV